MLHVIVAALIGTAVAIEPPAPDAKLAQARCAAAERIAFRLLCDFILRPSPKQINRIGPALRRAYEAEIALSTDVQMRYANAQRYHRLAYRFALSEKNAWDGGLFPQSDDVNRFRYFLADADVEVVRARRACGITAAMERDYTSIAKPYLSIGTALLDLLPMLLAMLRPDQDPYEGTVPIPEKVGEAIRTIFRPEATPKVDPELLKVLIARCEAATRELEFCCQVFQAGAKGTTLDRLYECLIRRLKSELELSDRLADEVKAYERAFLIAREFDGICEMRFKLGQITEADLDLARFHKLDQQIQLMRTKARLDAETKKPK